MHNKLINVPTPCISAIKGTLLVLHKIIGQIGKLQDTVKLKKMRQSLNTIITTCYWHHCKQ